MLMAAKDKDYKYYRAQIKKLEKHQEESDSNVLELTQIVKEKDREIKL